MQKIIIKKHDIAERISARTGVSSVACLVVLDEFIYEFRKCMLDGNRFTMKGFGSFYVSERHYNISIHENAKGITKSIIYKPSQDLRKRMNHKLKLR